MTVTIPAEEKRRWKKLKNYGDGKAIVEANPGISKMAIYRALKGSQCPKEVLKAISDFYDKKEELINEYSK